MSDQDVRPYSRDTVSDYVGKEFGVSSWITVDQDKIDQFAECTGDRQWVHVDVERAKKQSPLGGTIAHGFLSLSLLSALMAELGVAPKGETVLNYGLNKVRFINPVKSGARVRARTTITNAETVDHGILVTASNVVEIEGEDKPALVAEILFLIL